MNISRRIGIPAGVIVLGVVSFLTDFSSEMIFPLLPIFITTVLGATAISVGLIEGAAESIAAFLKAISGSWTDRIRRRKPFVLAGYGIAGIARPLIGLAGSWVVVFVLRFIDRIGKGIRTAPRDALIADLCEPGKRGTAFGFHRSMDHLGAAVGPLVAALLLKYAHLSLRQVFLLAAIPAALVIAIILLRVKEPPGLSEEPQRAQTIPWKSMPRDYKYFLGTVFLFGFANSSDAFLLLLLSITGVPAAVIALLWSIHHLIKTVSTYAGGRFADRIPRKRMIVIAWFLYSILYSGFALEASENALIALFLIYGLYFGLSEPAEKALVSDLTVPSLRGTAFGYYHAVIGFAALPANVLFGWLFTTMGREITFLAAAVPALIASIALGVRKFEPVN
jgi:MFS family permease